jgi:uncharacterized protein
MENTANPSPIPTLDTAAPDVVGRIERLFIYPVKSCAGIEVQDIDLYDTGLDLDRAWMVVDQDGVFVSQREYPRMALIQPQLRRGELILRAPGMLALHVSIEGVEEPTRVEVWDDQVPAYDMGNVAAQWFTDFLSLNTHGLPSGQGAKLRLVRFDPDHNRLASKRWTGGADAPTMFADGFPILVLSQSAVDALNNKLLASGQTAVTVERFRPNVVLGGLVEHDEDRLEAIAVHVQAADRGEAPGNVELALCKPCARCSIPDVDPATAQTGTAVADTLQTYRADSRVGGAVTFGMNAFIRAGVGAKLRVGQPVTGTYKFD